MINPLIQTLIPILHRILCKWLVKSYLHYLFPILYMVYAIYLAVETGYELLGISLSTVPLTGDQHVSIIFVIDPHTITFLFINTFVYFILVWKNIDRIHQFLPVLAVLTIAYFSLDLLICTILLSIVFVNNMLINKNYYVVNYYLMYLILFIIGFLFTNTFNIGVLVVYTKFGDLYGISENQVGIGLYVYLLMHFLLVFISINFYPLIENNEFDKVYKLIILIYSLSILLRLKPIFESLFTNLYSIYTYSLLVLTSLNMLNHSILYLKTRSEVYIDYYELSYIPLILIANTYFTYSVVINVLITYIIHNYIFIDKTNLKDIIKLSQIGLIPLIGSLSRILSLTLVIRYLGLFPVIIPLLTYMFMLTSCLTSIEKLSFNNLFTYISIVLNIVIILLLILVEPVGMILYKYPDTYYKIIFGV